MNDWMFAVNFIMNLLTWVVLVVGGFFLRSYLPTYFQEKGKNLATKEDIEDITDKVERIRSQYTLDQEQFKSQLQEKSEMSAKKRELYDKVIKSLGVFLSGRSASEEKKQEFLDEYSALWLWASDSVIGAVKDFLDLQVAVAREAKSIDQEKLKQAYTNCVLEMRRSVGFPDTKLDHNDYRFVHF